MDWKTKSTSFDNAIKALAALQGDESARDFVAVTLKYLDNERRRLAAELAELKSTGHAARAGGKKETLRVSAGTGEYSRPQPYIIRRWTCEVCGASHEREQLPGNTPKYCPPAHGEKMSACQREANRLRVKAHRAKAKQSINSVTEYAKPITNEPTQPHTPRAFYVSNKYSRLMKKGGKLSVKLDSKDHKLLIDLADVGLVEVNNAEKGKLFYRLTEKGLSALSLSNGRPEFSVTLDEL